MDFRKVMYVVLIVVCVASIAIGVYSQVTKPVRSASTTNESTEILYEGKTQETLKKEFYDMFDNQIHIGDFDTSAINKGEAEILFTCFKRLVILDRVVCIGCHFFDRNAEILAETRNTFSDLFDFQFGLLQLLHPYVFSNLHYTYHMLFHKQPFYL